MSIEITHKMALCVEEEHKVTICLFFSLMTCDREQKQLKVSSITLIVWESFSELSFTTETFKPMSKLRFLDLSYVNLTGSFEQTLES